MLFNGGADGNEETIFVSLWNYWKNLVKSNV